MKQDSQFDDLPIDLKISMINRYGVFVDTVKEQYHIIDLYSIDKRFLEVWRCIENDEVQAVLWADDDRLQKFLMPVNLDVVIGGR